MLLLSIENISVSYNGKSALQNASLEVFEDDFLGIIGPNGGGKTTLVKSIIGLVEYSGHIHYNNDIFSNNNRFTQIGYLPQQNNFDTKFPISIFELVLSGLQERNKAHYTKKDKNAVRQLLEFIGIADLADRQISNVSGGQLQRALLCRAIISKPKLLILDEPANFVDNKFEKELYELLKELNKEMAIIMVSHDVGTITSVVKNIVCVNHSVHRHDSNIITSEQLENYNCPLQIISHGEVPHTVLKNH